MCTWQFCRLVKRVSSVLSEKVTDFFAIFEWWFGRGADHLNLGTALRKLLCYYFLNASLRGENLIRMFIDFDESMRLLGAAASYSYLVFLNLMQDKQPFPTVNPCVAMGDSDAVAQAILQLINPIALQVSRCCTMFNSRVTENARVKLISSRDFGKLKCSV